MKSSYVVNLPALTLLLVAISLKLYWVSKILTHSPLYLHRIMHVTVHIFSNYASYEVIFFIGFLILCHLKITYYYFSDINL